MTTTTKRDLANEIAGRHGVDIVPGANHKTVLVVRYHLRQGFPLDGQRIAKCRAEIEAAGISTDGWLS